MVIELPDEVIANKKYSEQELKLDLAVLLFQREIFTLARAARWAGLTRLQFQKCLAERGIPIHFTVQDFKIDLQTLQSMPN